MTASLINHLWQSTLFALVAGLLTLALKPNGARFRYVLWFAASAKFLIPFAMLDAAGGWILLQFHPLAHTPDGLRLVRRIVEPLAFGLAASPAGSGIAPPTARAAQPDLPIGAILLAVWAVGAAAVMTVWMLRWRRVHKVLLASAALDLSVRVPARSSPGLLEPGVVGLFRQVLLFPSGIEDHLSAPELEAILAHEIHHMRRRDNLTAAIHMVVEVLFWFYPLVWWIGGRLIAERERACDEGVVAAGIDPRTYAEGILKVCRFYLQSPLACASGVSGSNLKRRLEIILTGSCGTPLSVRKTMVVSAAAALSVATPLAAGLIAAVPASARTAILGKAGLKSLSPAASAANISTSASNDAAAAGSANTDSHAEGVIAETLSKGAEIVAAPGDALVASIQIDPLASPELSMAGMTGPQPEQERGGGVASDQVPPQPPASLGCRLSTLATFRVDPRSYLPLIDGQINGRKVQFVVAVSSPTAIFRSAARSLGVFEDAGREIRTFTPIAHTISSGWVHDLELDDMPRKVLSSYDVHEDFRIAVTDGGAVGTPNPAAVLGAQFWALADDDVDLRSNTLSLVRPADCSRKDILPFNGGAYSKTPLLTSPTRAIVDLVTVKVDGVSLVAEIDTSATTTLMTRQGAFKLNHVWPLPNAQPQGELFTGDRGKISWAKVRFRTFSIGEETIQNPRIAVADLYDRTQELKQQWMNGDLPQPGDFSRPNVTIPDVILGADFFYAHHVLISNSRRTVYFVYNNAPIFN